ncbi:hypothetical protein [Cyanobium sp. FACHB-13342]|uniref:hypothetical protein n=1 Tax=Cyanobium sp. FACHB-13342 TaxID=2692793 RepID=UPI0016806FDE|nr:hypothetical protein [Cyanobium sp. FACHB-13342]MBD2423745.1 hypothetical protein [Cyanobium sp. FACHB-13342]
MPRPLVLVAAGPAAAVIALQQQAGPPLASALGLPWCGPLADRVPQLALAPLAQQGPGLVPLPLDPGLPLPGVGHWAEALGAWRQPVLLLLAGDQLHSGLPAAMVALLLQWQVPLAGLVQWGGSWDREARRADGLPWLGWLPPEGAELDGAERGQLARALELRWRQIVDA